MKDFSPREIVSELDRYIIGQTEAKKAVAIALRNRWRRKQLEPNIREEVLPKNILMIGPTGCGKTEIARRLAKLSQSPFIKVEATKFTEVGYVGRDVEQIIRDLLNIAIKMEENNQANEMKLVAEKSAEKRIIESFLSKSSSEETYRNVLYQLRNGKLNDKEIEIEIINHSTQTLPTFDFPGGIGGMINLNDIFNQMNNPKKYKKKKMKILDAMSYLIKEETEKLIDRELIQKRSIEKVEQDGIVFIDEIDKITMRNNNIRGNDISREGVQRDLLPLIEGTSVTTKYGIVKTDHILFITSGAFHQSKPSDLLAELQGRLPIRVTLDPLQEEDFIKILTETDFNLIKQYKSLMQTEQVMLDFTKESIKKIAQYAVIINTNVENIGARRLHTILEKILEDISFSATDHNGDQIIIDENYVDQKMKTPMSTPDLDKFIL